MGWHPEAEDKSEGLYTPTQPKTLTGYTLPELKAEIARREAPLLRKQIEELQQRLNRLEKGEY